MNWVTDAGACVPKLSNALHISPGHDFRDLGTPASSRYTSRRSIGRVTTSLDIRILGPLEVRRDDRPLNLGGVKQRTVLGLLLLYPNEVVSVGGLVQAVWGPDASPSAARTLQVYLSKLRGVLDLDRSSGEELIVTSAPGYRCVPNDQDLDLLRFEQRADIGRAKGAEGDAAAAVDSYRQALGMWRGRVLADLVDHSRVIEAESDRLELARLALTADYMDAELALGNHGTILPGLDRLVADNPLDERFRGQLMIALYRSGRHADALSTFRAGQEILREELGLEPGAELQELEERILMHDPELRQLAIEPPGSTTTIERNRQPAPKAWLSCGEDRYELDRAVTTIGRLPDRSIVVDDQIVSRRHAEIRRVGSRFAVVDVGSTNGVSVNGRTILEHDLKDGDTLEIGTLLFTFRTDGA